MFAQVDYVALDLIESDEHPTFRYFKDDDTEGVTIAIGNAVVLITPLSELAHKLIEISEG
jgi:hypothetical protein